MKVLVTGATGFLGEHLVCELERRPVCPTEQMRRVASSARREEGGRSKTVGASAPAALRGWGPATVEQRRDAQIGAAATEGKRVGALAGPGWEVRAMARSGAAPLEDLGVEVVSGDVLCAEDCEAAVEGCEGVFHLAGIVSRNPKDAQLMMRVHVDGTRRIFEAAARAGVRRIVVASSSGTIAVSEDAAVHDESAAYATDVVGGWPYYTSKIFQEKVAFELGSELGIETVCVNPSLLLGPGDRRLSSTRDVLRFLRNQVPVIPRGGLNFVDARDAAAATAAAMIRGRGGERYLLGGPNWTFKEFFGRLGRVARVSGPRIKLPGSLARLGAGLMEQLYRAGGKEPPVDRVSVEMGEHFWYVDSSKAERELGFEARDPGLTLADTVKYLRQSVATDL